MKLSQELIWRGFYAKTTIADLTSLDRVKRNFYWGTDPSADSLHIGHLAALMMCACFVRHGYKPYFLVGGATGQIGDPKENSERELKSLSEIEHNKKALAAQIIKITQSDKDTVLLDNYDWFKDIKYLDFLREIGKAFSMTQLLDRQFVKNRIGEEGSGISYAEFSYTLIQGYDFLHLFREKNIDLQLCGADQYGNCTSGIHLIKRLENVKADVYSCPLILDQKTGKKFGKSEGNAVWLSDRKTSIFDFYQFWLNQPDEAIETYFKQYTLVMPDQLEEILKTHSQNPSARFAQKMLAQEITTVVHGKDSANLAKNVTELLFSNPDPAKLSNSDLDNLAKFIPTVSKGLNLSEILVQSNLASSKTVARQLITSGAISLNGTKHQEDTTIDQTALIKRGKNQFVLVK